MIKKIGALALTAAMMLSLVGCSKKNFDGNYTAEIDYTDFLIETLEEESEASLGSSDYKWEGSLVLSYQLELSEGEYSLAYDLDSAKESFRTFMDTNAEGYMNSVFEALLASDESLAGITIDDLLELYGVSTIWEAMGYDSKDAFIDEVVDEFVSELDETETGDYEIDGDVVTLNGVEIMYDDGTEGDGWPLTYKDGDLTGEFYMDEDSDSLEVTFVRDAE